MLLYTIRPHWDEWFVECDSTRSQHDHALIAVFKTEDAALDFAESHNALLTKLDGISRNAVPGK